MRSSDQSCRSAAIKQLRPKSRPDQILILVADVSTAGLVVTTPCYNTVCCLSLSNGVYETTFCIQNIKLVAYCLDTNPIRTTAKRARNCAWYLWRAPIGNHFECLAPRCSVLLSLVPRPFRGRKRAWYTLHVHAPNTLENLGELHIIVYYSMLSLYSSLCIFVSSASVEKCLMVCFVEGSTSEPYLPLVRPVLVHAERVNV